MLLDDLDRTIEIDAEIDAEEVSHVRFDKKSRASGSVAVEDARDSAAAVLPDDAPAELVEAAERLAAAGYTISRADDDVSGSEPKHDGAVKEDSAGDDDVPVLSLRELEVLALLTEGAPNKVIARRLDVSVHTAKFHVASIIAKLGAANRTDAMAIAVRQGLVEV